ncbi:MAG: hypothetical protein OSJ27_03990 [Candidatus Gastranaerophilales bacterium]|nr:hypothetical protein [Candidatus Gastranaerophilales bacterium]
MTQDRIKDYMWLAWATYGNRGYDLPQYKRVFIENITDGNEEDGGFCSGNNGFRAAVYSSKERAEELIIAFCGTNSAADIGSAIDLMKNKLPKQYSSAKAFYDIVVNDENLKNKNVVIIGHSLGGALAQLVGAITHKTTYSFNGIGVRKCLPQIGCSETYVYSNVHSYCIMNDWFGMQGGHIGELRLFPPAKIGTGLLSHWIDPHNNELIKPKIDFSKTYLKPAGFNEQEALSLWYYDINNKHLCSIAGLSSILSRITARVSVSALENAISILRSNPQFIEHELKYRANGKTYILGLPEKENIIIGSKDNEIIYGGNKTDSMTGGAGKDELHGFEGNDTLRGGSGDDTLYAGEGNSIVYGDAGNDVLYTGISGNCTLYGGSGNDILVARPKPYKELKKIWGLSK